MQLREDGKGVLASELRDEKAAALKWKRKAEEYKAQLVKKKGSFKLRPAKGAREKRSSGSSSSFSQRLSQAKADADEWRRKADAYKAAVASQDNAGLTKCDSKGCWTIDTSDPATRATLQAFHAAAGPSRVLRPPMDAVAVAANAAVEAKTREGATSAARSTWARTSLSDKPLAKNLEKKCDNPYHHVETAEEACRYVHSYCPQSSGIFNYQALPYCALGASPALAVTLLIVWLVALSIWLGMAADLFLCPCLTVMSQMCHMSENVAGPQHQCPSHVHFSLPHFLRLILLSLILHIIFHIIFFLILSRVVIQHHRHHQYHPRLAPQLPPHPCACTHV